MFDEVLKAFGQQADMARALGLSRARISQFKKQGYFSSAVAIKIQALTRGTFKAEKLVKQDNQ